MKHFKKIIVIGILLCLSICLVSCGETSNYEEDAYVKEDTNISDNSESTDTYVMNDEEEALAKLLVIASQRFKYPTSVKIKNVWVWEGDAYWYTFELESKNDYGNMVSDYYGGMSTSGDLSDSTLKEIDEDMSLIGETYYFRKNGLSAKENGSKINPECISAMQEYYLDNI